MLIMVSLFAFGKNSQNEEQSIEPIVDSIYQFMRKAERSVSSIEQLNNKRYQEMLEDYDRSLDGTVAQLEFVLSDKRFQEHKPYVLELFQKIKQLREQFPSTAIRAGAYDVAKVALSRIEALELKNNSTEYFVRASFFQYPGFDDSADIELFFDGSFKSEWGFAFEPNLDTGVIVLESPSEYCSRLKDLGLFELPESISPEAIPIHGPRFSISAECDLKKWRVNYLPAFEVSGFNDEHRAQVEKFIAVWDFIWKNSKAKSHIKQPPPSGF